MRRWISSRLLPPVLVSSMLLASPAAARPPRNRQAATRQARSIDAHPRRAVVQPGASQTTLKNSAPPGDDADRMLASTLDNIVGASSLKSAVNGIYIVDAVTGRELYAYGADRQLNPASNTKLVSTAAALDSLGGDFTYQTRLVGPAPDEQGTVSGDVQLVGSSDPTLGPNDLRDLAKRLAAAGVHRIDGDVVISSDSADALAHAWVNITIAGGERAGDHARVQIAPDSAFFVVDNGARTIAAAKTRKKGGPRLSVDARMISGKDGERMRIIVSGGLRPGEEREFTRPVPRPTLYAAHTLRAAMLDDGIEVRGGVRLVKQPEAAAGSVELARHESVPLRQLAAFINKPSNNYLADRLLLTLAGERFGERSMTAGVRAMGDWLEKIGVERGTYRFENGSGLSHTIHVSARQIAQVLVAGAKDQRFGQEWLDSFAIGGKDGTLRGRFAGHPVAGYVRGKTGTLNGVAALSGFVTLDDDANVCFAILTSGFRERSKADVRRAQAAIVDAIFAYLHGKRGTVPAPAQPAGAVGDDEAESDGSAAIEL